MKDQYTGDINDYRKYALLRALAKAHGGLLHICWMLTVPDGRTDGGRLAYLANARSFRGLDPPVFDVLGSLVSRDRRSVAAVEVAGLLSGATFHADILADHEAERGRYFARFWRRLGRGDLVFFDPDNGLEVPSVARGRRNSSKYLYWDELTESLREGRSACIYQHFPRRPRAAFVDALLDRLRALAPDHDGFAVRSSSVAFIVCTPRRYFSTLAHAAEEVAARPGSGLAVQLGT